MAIRRPSAASSNATRSGCCGCSSTPRRSRSGSATSTCGVSSPRRRIGHLASVAGHPPALAARHQLRHVRFRALHPDVREQAFREIASNAPYDVVEILTNARPMAAAASSICTATVAADSAVGAVRLRPRVRSSHRRPCRRVLHVRRRLSAVNRPRRAVGAERDGAARSGDAEVEGSRDAGTPLPTPWPKEEFESDSKARQERRRKIRSQNRPESEMNALFRRRTGAGHGAFERGAARAGRWERSREPTTRPRLLPAAVRLHHVHPRRGAVLRGLPACDRDDTRSLHEEKLRI